VYAFATPMTQPQILAGERPRPEMMPLLWLRGDGKVVLSFFSGKR
jgi:hypothetical protein